MENIFGKKQENDGTVSLEELENAFRTPTQRQDYYEQASQRPDDTDLGTLADPDGSAHGDLTPVEDPISPEKAQRTGERIARLIDTGIDFALSNFVAHNGHDYHADERDLQDIADAWGEVSEEHNWSLGPEWTLAILYIMVYGPLVKQAFTDRRLAAIEAEQRSMKDRITALENQKQDNDGSEIPNPNPFSTGPSKTE